ncbi:synergin gamma-like isoform X1 [Sinocyclocheilus grahami]|uniref:synergin gamma-like isoform X1 n=1 Tax=Sinocyclocheilus grahami TaxID=75366 RepID=UPI0007ACF22C|nr:PREDICTED: synergin gamma-like isoform X1 [Sinocyclocheilus grahami]
MCLFCSSFIYPVGGGIGPPQGMMPMQQQQQGFPMVQVMQPNMQGMMGMNFGAQMPGAMQIQGGMAMGMQTPGMQFMGQPQFMGMRGPGPQFPADLHKQMAEEHQKRLEQQQRMLEENRKRRQFEEQKQKLRLLSSVKPKTGEKSRDDALEAIKGNLDGFSRDAKMHPTPSSQSKKPDSSHSSVTSHSLPPAFSDDDDEFSGFVQGPVDASSSFPSSSLPPSSPLLRAAHISQPLEMGPGQHPPPSPLPHAVPSSLPVSPAIQHSSVISSSQSAFQGPSLEEKMFSSCDLTADMKAQVSFKPRQGLSELNPKSQVTAQFHSSTRARNWAQTQDDFNSGFIIETAPESLPAIHAPPAADNPPIQPASTSGVGVYPQQDMQPMVPSWLYNDSLIPELFKKVLEFTMTPTGIDTAKLYPILISSGLPREALGQIWALANRTTPGKLTKEELYTVLALIGVAQSGLTVMSLEILSQFPSPPVPNLPAMAMAIPAVLPQHQQPIMTQPPVSLSMAMPVAAPPVMGMTPNPPAQQPASFITNFPPVQTTKADDDDFQDFQEAPKAGAGDDSFTDFQGETGGAFPNMTPSSQSGVPAMLTPVSGSSSSSSSDKYAVFKQLSVEQPAEPTPPVSDSCDKYSVFRELEQPSDRKPVGEGFADFKSVSADDGFTDFKTADTVSPLDPPDQAKFQPTFPPPFSSSQSLSHSQPASLAQPRNHLNMADLDLFTTVAPPTPTSTADSKGSLFPSAPPSLVLPSVMKPPSVRGDDFGDFALFGSSSSSDLAPTTSTIGRGTGTTVQDDFADFMAFGSSRDQRSETSSGDVGSEGQAETSQQRQQISTDKYDVFKQLSLEGGLAYDDNKESVGGSFLSLKSDNDDFADFQSSKFCTALGASDKSLVDKVAAFKQAKEDSASVKSLDLPSIGGSSVGKEDSEDALSIQLDMKLSDMGGDLKHVMSDSSLDLPGLSSHQPPAAESDDLKFDPFGTSAVSSLGSYDWPDKEDLSSGQSKKLQGGLPSSAVVQKKETSFGSSENITHTTVAKVTTFPIEDGGSTTESRFEAFADFGSIEKAGQDNNDDFGDFASTVSEKSDSPPGTTEAEGNQGELTDEFKAFQGDKPKFGKSDFLKASTQAKVKSSEEMIKNELATFDLSVQGSHKRSHSLGEKEIVRSIPSPAPEQPFRDRSNTLNEKPALPIIRDKYKDLTGEVEESERYAYEWQRCLESALQVITTANNTLNGISSSTVCTEVIQSAQGMEYLLGVVEVYRVTKHVELGIKATAVCSEKLQELLKDISRVWNNLMGFMSLANLTPDESSLDFSSCILRHGIKNAKELACGVCLLNVDSRSKALTKDSHSKLRAFNSEMDNFKLIYGGHQYHASCANFWINCVEPKPPGLILPDLL